LIKDWEEEQPVTLLDYKRQGIWSDFLLASNITRDGSAQKDRKGNPLASTPNLAEFNEGNGHKPRVDRNWVIKYPLTIITIWRSL